MQLPRPDDLTWRTAGLDIRHARKETYRCGGSAQNPRGTMPSRQNRLCVLILLAAVALAALAVSSALAASPAGARSAATVAVPRLVWHRCASPAQQGFQCATARVPLDYSNPRGPTIHLAVIRHRASDRARRIGALFINPGGPGASGTGTLPSLLEHLPPTLRALQARFDIASWDPRGVGASTAVKCLPTAEDEIRFLHGMVIGESFPVGRAEMDRWIERYRIFDRLCAKRDPNLLRHVSTADTARDLDLLRAAVGDRRLSYLGFSYGTFLGATYANLFPSRVRALVLDGNINPKAYVSRQLRANHGRFLSTDLRQRSDQGSARDLNAFLDLCGRTDTAHCAFSAGSAAATRGKYFALLRRLRAHPQSSKVSYAEAVSDTGSALDATAWPDLANLLQQVWTTGQENRILSAPEPFAPPALAPPPITDSAASAPQQSIGQTFAIRCSESPNPGPAGFRSLNRFAYKRSGPIGPWWFWQAVGCASWSASAADRYAGPWNRRTANPVLVVGNTYDPNTPYHGARAMVRELARARLLTLDGYGHTSGADHSVCVFRAYVAYFVHLRLPPRGAVCQPDRGPFDPDFGQPLP
jgi:pimeloyl-ACP methyl ester carboxylesterase